MKLLMEDWRSFINERVQVPPSGFLEGSVYKEPLYHGSGYQMKPGEQLSPNQGSEYGIYLTPSHRYARGYGANLYSVFVNIQNPIYVEGKYEISPKDLTQEDVEKLKAEGYDGIVVTSGLIGDASEIVAFDSGQVHVSEVR